MKTTKIYAPVMYGILLADGTLDTMTAHAGAPMLFPAKKVAARWANDAGRGRTVVRVACRLEATYAVPRKEAQGAAPQEP